MDPQERLFLQCVHERWRTPATRARALERAAAAAACDGNVGVFVGVMYEEYQLYGAQEQARGSGFALSGSAVVDRQPRVVLLQPARAEPGGGHDVLLVADRDPPGLPEPADVANASWPSPAA